LGSAAVGEPQAVWTVGECDHLLRLLTTSRLARGLAVGAGLALGVGLVPASRVALRDDLLGVEAGVGPYVPYSGCDLLHLLGDPAAIGRSFRAGIQAAVWIALLGTLAVFVIGLLESLHWYQTDARLMRRRKGLFRRRRESRRLYLGSHPASVLVASLWSDRRSRRQRVAAAPARPSQSRPGPAARKPHDHALAVLDYGSSSGRRTHAR
jgi:hypothetical protein